MMCRRIISRYLANLPRSILDIGCGTARDLDALSHECADCWGVDYLAEMIEFAKARRPHLHLQVADMRTLRLGRTFDAIMCMGSAFMYALTNADVSRVLDTFVAHSHPGTLLILDINNAASYLGGDQFKQTSELRVSSASFSAVAHATYRFDRRRLDAMLAFLADFEEGKRHGRYLDAELPALPFADASFDLALCSHFLFLYTDHLTESFHHQAITEMCRVATEVRVFPLVSLGGRPSPYVGSITDSLRESAFHVSIERVPYEFQRGAHQMLRIRQSVSSP